MEQNSKYERKCTAKISKIATKRTKREGLLSKLLIAIFQKLFEIEPWNLVLLLIFTVCSKFHWNLKRWFSDMSWFDVEFPSWKWHLFWQKTALKIHNSVKTWYFDGKIKSFWKLMICFSYFCQKNCFPLGHGPMTPFLCKLDPKNNLYPPVQSLHHTLYMWDCSHYEMRENKQHLSCAFP